MAYEKVYRQVAKPISLRQQRFHRLPYDVLLYIRRCVADCRLLFAIYRLGAASLHHIGGADGYTVEGFNVIQNVIQSMDTPACN